MNDNDFHDWLKGWREISEYLGRSRRTVMRWEKSGGFPVMRDVAGRPIASRLHIDRWIIDMNLEMLRWADGSIRVSRQPSLAKWSGSRSGKSCRSGSLRPSGHHGAGFNLA